MHNFFFFFLLNSLRFLHDSKNTIIGQKLIKFEWINYILIKENIKFQECIKLVMMSKVTMLKYETQCLLFKVIKQIT